MSAAAAEDDAMPREAADALPPPMRCAADEAELRRQLFDDTPR